MSALEEIQNYLRRGLESDTITLSQSVELEGWIEALDEIIAERDALREALAEIDTQTATVTSLLVPGKRMDDLHRRMGGLTKAVDEMEPGGREFCLGALSDFLDAYEELRVAVNETRIVLAALSAAPETTR